MILGYGIDLVYIPRLERSCLHWGARFVSRIFTPSEMEYCYRQRLPYNHFSGRFAAKEAFIKAVGGLKTTRWTEMEVLPQAKGAPKMIVHGETAQLLSDRQVRSIFLSISHDHNYSVAMVYLSAH